MRHCLAIAATDRPLMHIRDSDFGYSKSEVTDVKVGNG